MSQNSTSLDHARQRVLDRMDSGRRLVGFAAGAAALLEAGMLIACILLVDWSDRTQILFFIIFILSYFILVLGMVALAGHVTSATGRILAALDPHANERS